MLPPYISSPMRLPFLVVILFLLPPHSITFSLRRTPTLSVPNAPPLPPLFTRAYDLLSTGNFLFDRISPTLRSTEATFRGLYSYTNTLDQESRSDSAAIIRLGINVTESISSLSKFQVVVYFRISGATYRFLPTL